MHSKSVKKFTGDDINSNCWIRWKRLLEKKKIITKTSTYSGSLLCGRCNRMLKHDNLLSLNNDAEGSDIKEIFEADLNKMHNERLNICSPWPQVYMIDPKFVYSTVL